MIRPVLILQGFQRAFVEHDSPLFSRSATMRRSVCEKLLGNARSSGWTVIHSHLALERLHMPGVATISGFAPMRLEAYFRQSGLSAFRAPGFNNKFDTLIGAPAFLISFAGLSAIGATFFDAFERQVDLSIVTDAVADIDHAGVGEDERLALIEGLARAHDRQALSSTMFATERRSSSVSLHMAAGEAS